MSKIVLVGLPGCGKSTIGRILGRRLGLPCIDLDFEIERELGCSIKSFFQDKGESEFRLVEASIFRRILVEFDAFVLATGGGIVLQSDNRLLLEQEFVVYLMSQPNELIKRLKNDQTRPLLQTSDMMNTLVSLYAVRHPLYEAVADLVVLTTGKSAPKVADEISSFISK